MELFRSWQLVAIPVCYSTHITSHGKALAREKLLRIGDSAAAKNLSLVTYRMSLFLKYSDGHILLNSFWYHVQGHQVHSFKLLKSIYKLRF